MFVLVMVRSRAISQDYLYFYGYCLFVLLIIVFLLCFMISDMRKIYRVNREKLKTVGVRCITDPHWKKVPQTMYEKTDMSSEHFWAEFFLAVSILVSVVAIWFLYSISTQLEEMNKPIGTWAVNENL